MVTSRGKQVSNLRGNVQIIYVFRSRVSIICGVKHALLLGGLIVE